MKVFICCRGRCVWVEVQVGDRVVEVVEGQVQLL